MIPLIIIAGPTATGKSAGAINLAKQLETEIINADSMQVYKYFNIGTAKPFLKEQQSIPHHLIDIINPDEEYSAGRFKKEAEKIIGSIHEKKKLPVIVGGTGLYIKALIKGMSLAVPSDPGLRKKLHERVIDEGVDALYAELLKVDCKAAEKIKPTDAFRIERALEVYYLTGNPISSFQSESKEKISNYNFLYLILNSDRERLYKKINERVDMMINNGLMGEVESIINKGYSEKLKPFQSIGYKEIVQCLNKEITLEEAVEKIKQGTRNYAKRQLTWFNKAQDANKINIDFDNPGKTDEKIIKDVREYFNL